MPIVGRKGDFLGTKVVPVKRQGTSFMTNLFSAIASKLTAAFQKFSALFSARSLQRFVSFAFVGLFLLTTSVDTADLKPSTKAMLNDMIARGEEGRPVTTGQWQAENEKLQGKPAKQAKRIAKESADAVGEMGEIYPGNVKTLTPGLENETLESDD